MELILLLGSNESLVVKLKKKNVGISNILLFLFMETDMKKKLILSEPDIKAVIAEKFNVDQSDVTIKEDYKCFNGQYEPIFMIIVESEVQHYDL